MQFIDFIYSDRRTCILKMVMVVISAITSFKF